MPHAIFQFFRFFPFSVISGQSGNENPDLLVLLESSGQARYAGTLQMSVGVSVEQIGQKRENLFSGSSSIRIRISGFLMAPAWSLGQAWSEGTPTMSVGALVPEQNGRETDFPVPDLEFPGSVHPGLILGSAWTQRYPTCGPRGPASLNSYLP